MSGFNMPPGVSPGDIPGNGPEDDVTERITDGQLDALIERFDESVDDPPAFASTAIIQLRARVRELEDEVRGQNRFASEWNRKYNALREVVRDQIQGCNCLCDACEKLAIIYEGGGEKAEDRIWWARKTQPDRKVGEAKSMSAANTALVCLACHGTGKRWEKAPGGWPRERVRCWRCGGSGKGHKG